MSEPTPTLTFPQRIMAASKAMAYMKKDGKNSHFRYSFISEAAVKAKLNPLLQVHNIFVKGVTFDVLEGSTASSAVVSCTLTLGDALGKPDDFGCIDTVHYMGVGGGQDSGDKGPMKACAAALKYAITQGFLVETGDDPENDNGDASGPDAVLRRIADASSVKELKGIKTAVQALRQDESFEKVKAAYQAKVAELTPASEAA